MTGEIDDRPAKPGLVRLQFAIDEAEEIPPKPENMPSESAASEGPPKRATRARAKPKEESAPPAAGGGTAAPIDVDNLGLPPNCPVTPLGINGTSRYYLDADQQLVELKASDHTRLTIMTLFGSKTELLYEFWPRKTLIKRREGTEWETTGWRPELAAEALSAACARLGKWDSYNRVRGPGAWRGDDGALVLHCGDGVLMNGKEFLPGMIGNYVYPGRASLPRPWPSPVRGGDDGPGGWLASLLRSWNWKRGALDADLLLGGIGCGMIGGAIDWRPLEWITGGSGTGKSTLQHLLEHVNGGRLIAVSDPSAAGIWQKLGHATLPVAIDEHEAEEDNRGGNAVLRLARLAASGTMMLRGGADHQGTEFTVRSMFFFFSILIPSLRPQDRNRIAVLELGPLRAEAAPDLAPQKLREIGRKILRRLTDGWERWPHVHAVFRDALLAERVGARTADVYAALLSSAELIKHDDNGGFVDYAQDIALQLAQFRVGDAGDDQADEISCLQHILSTGLPLDGAGKHSGMEWIRRAAAGIGYEEGTDHAREILGNHGLKVLRRYRDGELTVFLAVAFSHKELNRAFQGTHWAARAGGTGVWKQALLRLPGAEPSKEPVWFRGGTSRAVLIPFRAVFPPDGNPERAAQEAESDAQ
jgi:hypothetical protein